MCHGKYMIATFTAFAAIAAGLLPVNTSG